MVDATRKDLLQDRELRDAVAKLEAEIRDLKAVVDAAVKDAGEPDIFKRLRAWAKRI